MKNFSRLVLLIFVVITACGPKPYYKTAKGKKKQKYYNAIQFSGKTPSELKKH